MLACTLKDAHEGALAALWSDKLRQAQEEGASSSSPPLQVVSAADGVASLLALKDNDEQVSVRKAGMLAGRVLQDYLLPKMEGAIDAGKRVKHAKLSGASGLLIVLSDSGRAATAAAARRRREAGRSGGCDDTWQGVCRRDDDGAVGALLG